MGYEECPIEKMGEILIDKLELDKVVITLGSDGMALWDKETGFNKIPTVARGFDVSGAGDTVISVICCRFGKRSQFAQCLLACKYRCGCSRK